MKAMRAARRAALAGALIAAAAPSLARDCAVAAMEGAEVALWRDGAWRAVGPGALPAGELKLRTGRATRVEILCDDRLAVTVAPGAEVNLDALLAPRAPAGEIVLQVLRGLVGLVAPERAWRRLETRTPLAIAAARSTAWITIVDAEGGAAFFVAEGAIVVRPGPEAGFAAATLDAGEGISIGADGAAGPVATWSEARVARARAALGLGWR